MRHVRLALAVLFLALPVAAQTMNTDTLDAAADTVVIRAYGTDTLDVVWTLTGTATSTITWEMSIDGGTNWIASPFAKAITATANPATAATYATSGATTANLIIPIPSNCTHVRARMSSFTSGSLVAAGRPGRAVTGTGRSVATLYNTTSANNTALDTGTLDVSGWDTLTLALLSGTGTPAFNLYAVDDAGVTSTLAFFTSAYSSTWVGIGAAGPAPAYTAPGTFRGTLGPLPKRINAISGAIAGVPTRILIEGARR